MSKSKIYFTGLYKGAGELLHSQDMVDCISQIGNQIAMRCGDGYEATLKNMQTRPVVFVETATKEAAIDCEANNTLLKNLG